MHRPKVRRLGKHDQVDVAGQHLLAGIETGEAGLRGDVNLRGEIGFVIFEETVDPVLKQVADRHNLDILRRIHTIGGIIDTPPAAAEDPDTDLVGTGGIGFIQTPSHGRQRGKGGSSEKITAGKV